jgi:hypothetical protein
LLGGARSGTTNNGNGEASAAVKLIASIASGQLNVWGNRF